MPSAAPGAIDPNAEVTLEANPTSVEAERFRGYRAAGINRVSLGVQALNDPDLKRLGRMHSVDEALARGEDRGLHLRALFLRPDLCPSRIRRPQAWGAELERAIAHAVEHLSLYQLTIEPGTWFQRLYDAGKITVPDEETGRALYDITQETCEKHGLPAYEISNHARPGAESRHNLLYWRYGEYAGIGPGAHGRLVTGNARLATATEKHPETWLELVEREGHGIIDEEVLTSEAEGDEFLLMGLAPEGGRRPAPLRGVHGQVAQSTAAYGSSKRKA